MLLNGEEKVKQAYLACLSNSYLINFFVFWVVLYRSWMVWWGKILAEVTASYLFLLILTSCVLTLVVRVLGEPLIWAHIKRNNNLYIWKTSKLSEELKDNKVPDSDWIKYALIFLIFYTVTPYLMFLAPYVSNEVMITEAIGILVVSILGVVVTYRTNNRDGKTYILRSIALSIPLSFRFVALSVLVGMAIVSLDFGAQHYFIVELLSTFSVIALQALYFWRLNVHLKYINS